MTVATIMPISEKLGPHPKSSVRRTLLEGGQSAVKVRPATVQIMLTRRILVSLWPGRNT